MEQKSYLLFSLALVLTYGQVPFTVSFLLSIQ